MDADTILKLKPALKQYLHEFDGCFGRVNTRRHLDTYVQGQLGPLQRKSVEPIADAAGESARTLQEFLSLFRWDEGAVRDRLQQRVARRHGHACSVGIIDETSFVKKGRKTACVQRQHCGAVGKTENCVVSVHLGYATPEFHTLLDGELYLPEKTWGADRARRREAKIPDNVVYRPKWQIALGQVRRAQANGVRFAWLTFDEGYGGKPPFLRKLDRMGQNYVGEVPVGFRVWTRPPAVLYREHRPSSRRGRPRKMPRLKRKNNPPITVENAVTRSPRSRKARWKPYRVKDGTKGPMVWEVKHLQVWLPDENGLPTGPYHLLAARNVLEPEKIKYFISNAPEGTPTETLLLVAFSRWKIERMFETSKEEVGMDHFEVRRFLSVQRHLVLSCVSHLFLAEFCQTHGGEKCGGDAGPGADGDVGTGAGMGAWGPLFAEVGRGGLGAVEAYPTSQRKGPAFPPQADVASLACPWVQAHGVTPMLLEAFVAL
jgi:SRSO17 transposase